MTDLVRLYSTFCVIVRALQVFRNSSASEELDLTKSDVSGYSDRVMPLIRNGKVADDMNGKRVP